MRIRADELAQAIGAEIGEYFDEISSDVKAAVSQTARECMEEIKQKSPKKTGKYRKSWTITEAYNKRGTIRLIVHNKKYYRLTHLLENGHAKRGGGRVDGIPHIAPAEQHAEEKLIKKVEEAIRNDS